MSRASRRSSRSRRWRCASRRCCRCACAASIPRHEGEVARIAQVHRRRQTRRSHAGFGPRHRRPRHRADARARASAIRSRCWCPPPTRTARRNRACANSRWPACSTRPCRITTAQLLIAALDDVRALLPNPDARMSLHVNFTDALGAPSENSAALAKTLPAGRRDPRLDPGSRQLFPRHPHREDHGGDDPHADRRGGGVLPRGHAGDGGDRQAHRHRHPAHARHFAAPGHGDLPDPGQRHRLVRRGARRAARLAGWATTPARWPRSSSGCSASSSSTPTCTSSRAFRRSCAASRSRWIAGIAMLHHARSPLSTRRSARRACRRPTRCGTSSMARTYPTNG